MPTKNFEDTVRFYEHQLPDGTSVWLPLVVVVLITPNRSRITLSMLFDTGASVTSLRADLYHLLGLTSWNQGRQVQTNTANGIANVYQYDDVTFEVFGKTITCPIQLIPMVPNPLFSGLLGRDTIFREFGFGFWESSHELFVTRNPQD